MAKNRNRKAKIKNTFYSVKYMNLQEQRNKNNFVVVNNVYLHKID